MKHADTPGPLFAHTHARATDPATSKEASRRLDFAGEHHRKIIDYLRACQTPRHVYDIAAGTGMEPHAVGKRMLELVDAGLIVTVGIAELPTGRRGTTYKIKENGNG